MKMKQLFSDDSAVSPVIGVILMVAITVILAAVIGTFVLGIGQDQQTTPNASFDYNYDSDAGELNITHSGGDSFTSENSDSLTVQVSSGTVDTDFDVSAGVGAGATADVSGLSGGEDIRVIWTAPGGGKTQTVSSFTIP